MTRPLAPSHYRIGPDFPGCINSGSAPCIYRPGLDFMPAYIVADAFLILFDHARLLDPAARKKYHFKGYRTAAAAFREYEKRAAAMLALRHEAAEELRTIQNEQNPARQVEKVLTARYI